MLMSYACLYNIHYSLKLCFRCYPTLQYKWTTLVPQIRGRLDTHHFNTCEQQFLCGYATD